jgi:hypothetical protein
MSYFIANTISISKDRKIFKCKGGDNNLIPRSNSWTNDIDIKFLYSEINSGNLKLQDKSEKGCLITNLCNFMNFNKIYKGTWQDEKDYYHLNNNITTPEQIQYRIDHIKELKYIEEYENEKLIILKDYLENFDLYKLRLDNFHKTFFKELNNQLDNLKNTNKLKFNLYSTKNHHWVLKILPTKYKYVYDKGSLKLQEFGYHRANFEIGRFADQKFTKVEV